MSKRKRKARQQVLAESAPRRRAYEGAMVSRLTADWVTSSTSADAEIDGSLIRLRNRSRQLCRDNPYARQACRAIAANVVGRGIRLQSRVMMQRGGGRLDQSINELIESSWRQWQHARNCHVAGKLAFAEILRLAMRSVAESGEVFLRLVDAPFGGSAVPLGIEILEADLCDETKTSGPDANGDEWRMGVRINRWGRPLAYEFRNRHPGDLSGSMGYTTTEVPADQVIHLFVTERPGQTRGTPWMAAAIKRLHHLHGYEEAEVVSKRARSSLMGFITSPEGELHGDDVYEGERVSTFEPGVYKYLSPGESVNVPNLGQVDTEYEEFVRAMLRAVSAAIGCSYETISRDFSQSNYSSSRLSLLEDREEWRTLQDWLIEHVCQPIYERWLAAAVAVGALNLAGYAAAPMRFEAVRWFPRGWAWIDPEKEVKAYRDAVRCGFKTQAEVVAEGGSDLEDVLVSRAAEVERAEQLGLQLDTNPADDLQGGASNATPESSLPDPDDDKEEEGEEVAS